MSYRFADQYSLLHFASGVVAYFFDISFKNWFIIHLLFEFVENTQPVMNIINKYIRVWPGGKPSPNKMINRYGDQLFAVFGWLVAYYLDQLGDKYGWYLPHLKNKNIF